jgi:hypothetical protein
MIGEEKIIEETSSVFSTEMEYANMASLILIEM